jgi:hypothetical protein
MFDETARGVVRLNNRIFGGDEINHPENMVTN